MSHITGAGFASGAIGAGVNEAIIGEIKKIKDPAPHRLSVPSSENQNPTYIGIQKQMKFIVFQKKAANLSMLQMWNPENKQSYFIRSVP